MLKLDHFIFGKSKPAFRTTGLLHPGCRRWGRLDLARAAANKDAQLLPVLHARLPDKGPGIELFRFDQGLKFSLSDRPNLLISFGIIQIHGHFSAGLPRLLIYKAYIGQGGDKLK
jgi:hypothetical protein